MVQNRDSIFSKQRCYLLNRWFTFVGGLCLALIAGTPYMFSVYAPAIKDNLNYSQYQIELVGTFGNFGTYFGIIPGFLFDVFGPRPTGIFSAAMIFGGYFFIWMANTNQITSNYYVVGIFLAMTGLGSGTLYTVGLAPNVYNFPNKHKGKVVGIMAALFGLSSAFFTKIYSIFFKPDIFHFIFFISILIGAIGCVGSLLINYVVKSDDDEENDANVEDVEESINGEISEKSSLLSRLSSEDTFPQYNLIQVLLRPEFWFFVVIFGVGTGCGLLVINNLGNMVISLGGKNGDQDNFVIVLSICNFLGRVIFGVVSDQLSRWLNRPAFLIIATFMMGLSHLYLAFVTHYSGLWFGVICAGISYGGLWCTCPTMVHEMWGSKFFGTNFSMIGVAPAGGSYLFSTLLAGMIYQKHVVKHAGKDTHCYGQACYRETFLIDFGCCMASLFFGALLYWVTRKLYAKQKAAQHLSNMKVAAH